MTVSSAIAATGATSTPTSTSSSSLSGSTDIAGNFQQFLTLLTTQLKNQSPLDPLDTNQFTQQLVQFASVEQQLKTNATLTTLASGAKTSAASAAAGLIGASVTASGASSTFSNGKASWSVNAGKAASSATVTISDSTGTTVATQVQPLAQGQQTISWDGRALNGSTVTSGTYTISVTARDASGQPVTVSTDASGTVGSVDLSGDTPVLLVGGARVPLSSVKSIGAP